MAKRRQKYKTWDAVFKKKAQIQSPNRMPLLRNSHGKEIRREVVEDGAFRRITIFFTYGEPEVIEFCGKIRIR